MNLTLSRIRQCLTGDRPETGPEAVLSGVCTDSRLAKPGDLFVCLSGERFDGHNFAARAAARGAAAIVSSRLLPDVSGVPVIMVKDTLAALGRLARCWRDQTRARVVAVTGTAGKTTVKEALARVAACGGLTVAKNYKNFNNQIGLPLSMLRAGGQEDVWIMELGISLATDMDELGPTASPDLALITNIGPAHLAGLGDLEGVARAKASLFRHVRPGGVCLACLDYPLLWQEAQKIAPRVRGFSRLDRDAEFYCGFKGLDDSGRGLFELRGPQIDQTLGLDLCGEHAAENIAAVAAAAHVLELPGRALVLGLAQAAAPEQRFRPIRRGRLLIIDDSYNANPLSMRRALDAARRMAKQGPLVLVLGDMLELGDAAAEAHEDLGRFIRELAPRAVFFQGEHGPDLARGLGDNGLVKKFQLTERPEDLTRGLRGLDLAGAVILVKGSRACRMERYVRALAGDQGPEDQGARP
ncbi:MAG: UDP-N-acetylmuramoyl-tripeptide--D-alanyl-D-alanine ligase [Desulfovibrionaceae bacterium]|nr:UDP-N-acetylmuramoyl-tripeptide--D-alanyl-D-alanine ligase [Desulfovibrionaceae bacterium]